jgi:hypothetical protein
MTAKKVGGGKLTRSETVTVRLDPKLRYLAELAARKHRRTLSSYIEWAIEKSLGTIVLDYEGESREETLLNQASQLWDVDEADRVTCLALRYHDLLTHEEQVLWKLVCENGYLWRGNNDDRGDWCWNIREPNLIISRLRENWELFKKVAAGEEDKNVLPDWGKKKEASFEEPVFNPDDEIPF